MLCGRPMSTILCILAQKEAMQKNVYIESDGDPVVQRCPSLPKQNVAGSSPFSRSTSVLRTARVRRYRRLRRRQALRPQMRRPDGRLGPTGAAIHHTEIAALRLSHGPHRAVCRSPPRLGLEKGATAARPPCRIADRRRGFACTRGPRACRRRRRCRTCASPHGSPACSPCSRG